MIDLLIYVVGYETRSGYAPGKLDASKRLAIVFQNKKVFSYNDNLQAAQKRGDTLIGSGDLCTQLEEQIESFVVRMTAEHADGHRTVAVDVSSMSRDLMAQVLSACFNVSSSTSFDLKILYTTGLYEPPIHPMLEYMDLGALNDFEGWTSFPEHPMALVLGLGYEVDQALAAVEYFDPSGVWAFVPNGDDERFRTDVEQSNHNLWPHVPKKSRIEYDVNNPFRVFAEFSGLLDVLSKRARVTVVPCGPKIFSAIAMIAAKRIGNEISVWRASSHDYGELRDRLPAERIVEFTHPLPFESFDD